jgi:hypothetical protein
MARHLRDARRAGADRAELDDLVADVRDPGPLRRAAIAVVPGGVRYRLGGR